jgi:hypothetical protein
MISTQVVDRAGCRAIELSRSEDEGARRQGAS